MSRHDPADVVLIEPRALAANSPKQVVAAAMMKEAAEWQSAYSDGRSLHRERCCEMILNDNYANANMTCDCDHTCRTVKSGKQRIFIITII